MVSLLPFALLEKVQGSGLSLIFIETPQALPFHIVQLKRVTGTR